MYYQSFPPLAYGLNKPVQYYIASMPTSNLFYARARPILFLAQSPVNGGINPSGYMALISLQQPAIHGSSPPPSDGSCSMSPVRSETGADTPSAACSTAAGAAESRTCTWTDGGSPTPPLCPEEANYGNADKASMYSPNTHTLQSGGLPRPLGYSAYSQPYSPLHNGEKPYQCSICQKAFTQGANTAHLRSHSGEKPFKCPVCQCGFLQSSSVTRHLRTHSGNRPYKCNVCGKDFANNSTFTKHYRTHTGEKPYQCSICQKAFADPSNFIAHLRSHSGEKPFKCPVCQRGFLQRKSVTRHLRTHTGERPYKCNVCTKSFADNHTFTRHYRTHTGEKPYQCKICDVWFSRSDNLKYHMCTHRNHLPSQAAAQLA